MEAIFFSIYNFYDTVLFSRWFFRQWDFNISIYFVSSFNSFLISAVYVNFS